MTAVVAVRLVVGPALGESLASEAGRIVVAAAVGNCHCLVAAVVGNCHCWAAELGYATHTRADPSP